MKILVFLNNDIHAAEALRILAPFFCQHRIKIILSQDVGKVHELPSEILAMKNIEKIGASELFQNLAQDISAEIFSFQNINAESSVDKLKEFAPDLAISIRFGQIFKNDLIKLFPLGVLNLHSGILPKYRGIMASFWAILHGEKSLGTTLHYIQDAGIDTGSIIGFSRSEIDWNKTLIENIAKIYQGGCELIIKALEQIDFGKKLQTIDQKTLGESAYFSYPKEDDVKKFLRLMKIS